MNRRLIILKNTFLDLTFGGNLYHWILNLFSPKCDVLSRKMITNINKIDNFHVIYLKGITTPIYLLDKISLHSIYLAISANFILFMCITL